MPKVVATFANKIDKKIDKKISRTESFMSGVQGDRGNEKKTPFSNIGQLKNANTTEKREK